MVRERHQVLVCVLRYDLHLVPLLVCDDHDCFAGDEVLVLVVQNLVVRYVREHFSKRHED